VQAILKNGLDRAPLFEPPPRTAIEHDNIRGPSYFDKEEENAQRGNDSKADQHEAAGDGRHAAGDGDLPTYRRRLH
jgi:hypothetical protein